MSTIDHNKETHEVSRVFTSNAQQTTTVADGETIIAVSYTHLTLPTKA